MDLVKWNVEYWAQSFCLFCPWYWQVDCKLGGNFIPKKFPVSRLNMSNVFKYDSGSSEKT